MTREDADKLAQRAFRLGLRYDDIELTVLLRDLLEAVYASAALRAELAACKSDCATLAAVIPEIAKESAK